MWYNNVKGNACGALSFFIGKTKMQESLETKIARIDERLAVEVKGLNNVIAEFRTDMKSALSQFSTTLDKMGESLLQTQANKLSMEANKQSIKALVEQKKLIEAKMEAHRQEDQDFRQEMTNLMTEYKLKQKLWSTIFAFITGIVSSVVTAIIVSIIL